MPIAPDTKDWTWVLTRRCPECGFDARAFSRGALGELIRENAAPWTSLLCNAQARTRPSDDVWSAVEYACHVRDVLRLFNSRLQMMLEEDDPTYSNWDQNTAAVEQRYDEQNPSDVLDDLHAAAIALAERFDNLTEEQWSRRATRSDGVTFTAESLGRYLVHDLAHHVVDAEKGLSR